MPKVEVTLSSPAMAKFIVKRVFEYDDDDWEDMRPSERQQMIDADTEVFKNETVQTDYKVLS